MTSELVELPQELFLRELLNVDLKDESDVISFINEYGALMGPYGEREGGLLELKAEPSTPAPAAGHVRTHLGDVVLYLRTARVLARHWVAVLERVPVLDAWREEELDALVSDEEAAWTQFVHCLNAGLGVLRVRVERLRPRGPESVEDVEVEPIIGLYTSLCVQLFNHLLEAPELKRCANETCGGPFVRQWGGGASTGAGQYRTEGVMYCSASCGNAQWQREHRRRKRSEKKKP